MTIQAILDRSIRPLRADDTPQHAMNVFIDSVFTYLPVVDENEQLVGLVTEQQVLQALGSEDAVRDCLADEPVSVAAETHYFNAARAMVEHDIDLLPVTDAGGKYQGVVSRSDLFEVFTDMLGTDRRGAVLVLEIAPRDYSMGQLLHIIEQNDVKVLSMVSQEVDDETLRITLKLNIRDATRTRHMLDHHGYSVVAAFNEAASREELQDRAREFMRYLEV